MASTRSCACAGGRWCCASTTKARASTVAIPRRIRRRKLSSARRRTDVSDKRFDVDATPDVNEIDRTPAADRPNPIPSPNTVQWDNKKTVVGAALAGARTEEHTSALQPLMRPSYAVFCLTQKTHTQPTSLLY